jgi:hypothetical protein
MDEVIKLALTKRKPTTKGRKPSKEVRAKA